MEVYARVRRAVQVYGMSERRAAREFGLSRKTIRKMLAYAAPPGYRRKQPVARPKLGPWLGVVDQILEDDESQHKKQRHTARRIYRRILGEFPGTSVAESTVRNFVRDRKHQLGLLRRETFVPQSYVLGQEAQVDWYEAWVDFDGERSKVQVFAMRSMASGAAFHRAYLHATQQAFLEAHELAFDYFGGVFRLLRYDNLASAVRKILRGHRREETVRFLAFRSHWRFTAEFCTPAEGHEKGGIEGEAGYFRRNHLVPVPCMADLDALNTSLVADCRSDEARVLAGRTDTVGVTMTVERAHLMPRAAEGFDIAEIAFPLVDKQGCVTVKTNFYSVPVKAGSRVEARIRPLHVEIWHGGKQIARHERCHQRRQHVLDLEHYLDVLSHKPGAFAGSKPLAQWRAAGRWPDCYDELWRRLRARHGKDKGTQVMISVLLLGQEFGHDRLRTAIASTVSLGACDVGAVRYLLTEAGLSKVQPVPIDVGELARYDRPMPSVADYDALLTAPCLGHA